MGGREENFSKRFSVGGIPASGTRPPFGVLGFSSQAAPHPTGRTDTASPPPGLACSPRVRRPEVRSGPAIASRELEASRGFRSTPASAHDGPPGAAART